ncbi:MULTISPECIES: rod shape-determining protein MreD [unclassified Lentimicrobium]|uniref:rod shape-determining protein MreD n=1 Tax=unclassified Lentimicrobium TaxID=2677434 RepID=UPI0015524942|nr:MULTISPECIES: rod shape-determining protein MreD [unclassified Lentimicrobium]NPD44831.1 rod shape-determining protein MreD [Lentimicrobium sp. S6]NPD83152.1 rod shape-determining protein MreD [Lentimicrobium sp. L6]
MFKSIFIFFALVISQVLVFNHIQFSGYINPAFYVLFIILLPANTPAWLRLISGFLLGFSIDIFSQSPGLNAASTVLIAFLQPYILYAFKTTDVDEGKRNSLSHIGFRWFISYSIVLILIHHVFYFILEVFRFSHFLDTFYRIILSSFATFIAIFLSQLVIYKKQQ